MIKKIIKIGSSLGITLSSDQLRKLSLNRGSQVEVRFNPRKVMLEIEPIYSDSTPSEGGLLKKIDRLANQHREDLKSLENDW